MDILGIWDGHDSGAAVVRDGRILCAANEERFTRRKMEVFFPANSIKFCLNRANLKPADIEHVACSTSDFSMTLGRIFPKVKGDYYYVRRRKTKRPRFPDTPRRIQNETGKLGSNPFFRRLSEWAIGGELRRLGFSHNFRISIIDHHLAHAASAYYTSGYNDAVCVTIDALGDGISSTVNICRNGEIERIAETPTKDSLGLFFQEVTWLNGMRILEDEGKVMGLAEYAYPHIDNQMLKFFSVDGLKTKAVCSLNRRFSLLRDIQWKTPREQFCYMAQSALESVMLQLFRNAIEASGQSNVVWAGGIASNIKMNRLVKNLPELKNWFVFPHMGDGGLAAGAALYVANQLEGIKPYRLENVYLGPSYSDSELLSGLEKYKEKVKWEKRDDISGYAADLLSNNEVVFWYRGGMEYGPRALGHRSILAPAGNADIKDRLNLLVKKREWYQPFCPSMLEEEGKLLADLKGTDRFMTMGYQVKREYLNDVGAVIGVDGSARPQMVGDENPEYREMLKRVKRKTGIGIVLNTSFNIHGYPIVCTPEDALWTQAETRNRYLALGNYLVELK